MAGRRCPRPNCPRILTNGERYCVEHAREYETKRGTPAQRGYDHTHRTTRTQWVGRMASGEVVHCARCGKRLDPTQPWDLGHTADRTTWTGPECLPCNRGDGGRRGRATQA